METYTKVMETYAKAIRSLWLGRCTITVLKRDLADEATGRTTERTVVICRDEPCRISFGSTVGANAVDSLAQPKDYAYRAERKPTLFISSSIPIPPGSKITVTQNGRIVTYERSGIPAVYSAHQEVPLVTAEVWT